MITSCDVNHAPAFCSSFCTLTENGNGRKQEKRDDINVNASESDGDEMDNIVENNEK